MDDNSLSWKIGGEAGYGIMTTGLIFAKICSRAGLHLFACMHQGCETRIRLREKQRNGKGFRV